MLDKAWKLLERESNCDCKSSRWVGRGAGWEGRGAGCCAGSGAGCGAGCREGLDGVRGVKGILDFLDEEDSRDFKDLRYFAYAIISSSDHSKHSSQRLFKSQSKPRQEIHTVCRSADFLLILLGQEEHFRRPSTGVSTEESDEIGGTGGIGGVNPGSSKLNSLITENTKKRP